MAFLSKKLVVVMLVGLGVGGEASACGGRNGGNGGGNNGSCNNGGGYNGGGYNGGGYNGGPYNPNYGQAYEPFHSSYFVEPGDTFYEISLKQYGTSSAGRYIAQYNRLSQNAALVPNQKLLLPSISAGGRLTASRAPAAERYGSQGPYGSTTSKFTRPAPLSMTETAPPEEEPRPSVPSGSTLQLDGQSLGDEAGVVRLRINNVAFPVEVVEWSPESTKVRLPKLDVDSATKADLEITRADGSLAASNAIELTMPSGLAAN